MVCMIQAVAVFSLHMQRQADNQPLPDEVERATPLDFSQRLRLGSGASILRFLKNNILKPKQPTEIHSGSLSEAERDKTLAPFAMSGVEVGRVNRDYEAFFTSAWGRQATGASKAPAFELSSNGNMLPVLLSVPLDHPEQAATRPDRLTKQERPTKPLPLPAGKPRSRTSGDITGDQEERLKPLPASPQPAQGGRGLLSPTKRSPMLPPSGAGGSKHPPPEVRVYYPTPNLKCMQCVWYACEYTPWL